MRIFKHRYFQRWARLQKLTDAILKDLISEVDRGLHDGKLGSGLYKKRVGMPGKGKRGGYRTLLALKHNERAFFVYGFAKNVKADISPTERSTFKILAKELLSADEKVLAIMIQKGSLIEVK